MAGVVVTLLLGAATLVGLVDHSLRRSPALVRAAACGSNLKHIVYATVQYAEDWDQRLPCALPGSTAPAAEQLAAYGGSSPPRTFAELTRCPAQRRARQSYFYGAPDRLRLSEIDQPERLGLYGEGTAVWAPVSAHSGNSNVAFADGHVKTIREEQFPTPDGGRWLAAKVHIAGPQRSRP